ncbi:hypothetical protein CS0771_46680 [Catellatospora sp. IY07-71]|uniref:hypothetical protein n=1 Tax=Catellatospora sp. IY07-71 TaxID=2728827 RepID=UPI001BB3776C|nr:hypothetical protein [Catellatospora sp. IY07-71]BCJ75124.1 hypothetical protein CS0771_46680 [Catellatospora sp. IY07-71]
MSRARRSTLLGKTMALALSVTLMGCADSVPTAAEAATEQAQLRDCMSGWADLGRQIEANPKPD